MRKFLFVKVFAVLLVLFGFSRGASAQEEVFNKGDMMVNAGIGVGNYISYKGYSTRVLPILGSFEYAVVDLLDGKGGIGVGGYVAYTSFGSKGDENDWKVSDLVIGPRGLFHYQFLDKLDTYAGLMLGYDIVSYDNNTDINHGSRFRADFFVGARYYIANNIGVFAELGYNVAPLELGVCYKF